MKKTNTSVDVVSKDIRPFTDLVKSIRVNDGKSMSAAVDLLSMMNKQMDKIADEREKVTRPLNEALKAERARWKPGEDMLSESIKMLKGKITGYQMEEERRIEEAEKKILAGVESGKIGLDKATDKLDMLGAVKDMVVSGEGTVKFRTVKKVRIVDMGAIPDKYWVVDTALVENDLKRGIEVVGAVLAEEKVVVNYR